MIGIVALVSFIATIPAANWLIGNVGIQFGDHGPHLVPVGLGLMAPSGVLMVGLAFTLRDLVQRNLGPGWALAAIALGATISATFAPGPLVVASVAAFLLSELADLAVYTPLARRRFLVAVVASNLLGLVIDSAVFLLIAFGSLDYLPGQLMGKAWMTVAVLPAVLLMRPRET